MLYNSFIISSLSVSLAYVITSTTELATFYRVKPFYVSIAALSSSTQLPAVQTHSLLYFHYSVELTHIPTFNKVQHSKWLEFNVAELLM